jgi:hypothetical protein
MHQISESFAIHRSLAGEFGTPPFGCSDSDMLIMNEGSGSDLSCRKAKVTVIGSDITEPKFTVLRLGFLVLESLLNLFAIILPSTNNSPSGRTKRTQFIKDVFDSPQTFTCGQEVMQVLESVSTSDWETTAMSIIDILAESNIALYVSRVTTLLLSRTDLFLRSPQPFQLNEFHACNTSFLLPNATDRLYVDSKSFFANIDEVILSVG